MFDPISLIIQLVIGLVAMAASTIIKSMQQQDKQRVPGVRGERQVGGTNPMAFIVGRYGTAGQFEYGGEWGDDGGTPNAYRTEVYSHCDLVADGMAGRFINGKPVTLDASPHADLGYPVLEFRDGAGKDRMWWRDYTGVQTVADPLLLAKFGADPDRPWLSDMIFRGVAYSIVTSLVNRELFASAVPAPMFDERGIHMYDVRKDTTAGGSGSHRLDDPATWEWSDNPIVIIYNILLGIRYEGVWLWGGQDIGQQHLPYAVWASQMDKCDALVAKPAGGTEKRFRCGYEISVDQEPQAVIGELLKTCEGRIAEIGGTWKVLVAEPDAPVASVTTDDVVISEDQSEEPFPGLESLFNEMRADYPEPAMAWEMNEAPVRLRSDYEAADDGRHLPFSTSYKAAPYVDQVQRLMYAALEEGRRFRKPVKTYAPEWWEYEPLDSYLLTDAEEGYTDKAFLITVMDDLPNGNQVVGSQEIDPADYDPPDDEIVEVDFPPLVIARPAPQEIIGWNVAPYIFPDSAAEGRRIGIEIFYDEGLLDVRAVRVQVREDFGDNNLVFDGEFPYDATELDPSRALTWGGIIPDEDYEVRGIYVPFSGRAVEWSGWLGVTAPPIYLTPADFYPDLEGTLEVLNQGLEWLAQSNKRVRDDLQSVVVRLQDQGNTSDDNFQQVRTALTATQGLIKADYELLITTAVGIIDGELVGISSRVETLEVAYADPVSGNAALASGLDAIVVQITDGTTGLVALANSITSIETSVGDISADAKIRMVSQASSGSSYATVGIQARATTGDVWTTAAILLDSKSDGSSRVLLVGQRIGLMDSGGTVYGMFDATGAYFNTALIENASITNAKIVNATITGAKIANATITNTQIANATIGSAQIANAAIGNAQLGTAVIQTANIVSGNVSETFATQTAAAVNCSASAGGVTVLASVSVTASAGKVIITAQCDIGAGTGVAYLMYLRKNGVLLGSIKSISGILGLQSVVFVDSSPSTATYELVHEAAFTTTPVYTASYRSIIAVNNKV
ncbi:phage tail protein [Devosia sp. SL43]|uniref:phage tail protein n=1 Tax=Devosia sp. SL43 TaxID=2806348 RepID=UPI001F4700D9|nr:phage tail protein [Devosia sp. SL43]UJW87950.1 hypothetical protein IM737_20565 [Devosia sp. SL43]